MEVVYGNKSGIFELYFGKAFLNFSLKQVRAFALKHFALREKLIFTAKAAFPLQVNSVSDTTD